LLEISNFKRSEQLLERALKVTPYGVHSMARSTLTSGKVAGFPIQCPKFFNKAKGSRVFDVDGNEYIDYLLGLGPIILGHCHPGVNEFVKEQIEKADMFGANSEIEVELSEKIVKNVPCAEKVILLNTGTQANTMAVRMAKSYTGREKVIRFEGHYHGYWDWSLFDRVPVGKWRYTGISNKVVEENIILPWNDLDLVERFLKDYGNEIAAIICEPIVFNCNAIMPEPGFLEGLRKITKDYGIVLIFDEVVTGFRVSLGGFQSKFGVIPDLAAFGKAIGNGYPIAALAGKKEIMETRSYYGGTFNSHPFTVAASLATITELEKPGVYKYIYDIGETIIKGLRDAIEDTGIEAIVQGVGSCFAITFTELKKIKNYQEAHMPSVIPHDIRAIVFYQEMIKRGILNNVANGFRWCICAAHTKEEASKTIEVAEEAFKKAKKVTLSSQ